MTCAFALLSSGCFTRAIAEQVGLSGWFRADLTPKSPDVYRERFLPLPLVDPGFDCGELVRRVRDPSSPIVVLVPGIGGDGPEMVSALATLMQTPPASIFMFRWVPYDERDAITRRLAEGISRLAECLPGSEGRLLVVAHSAGGVAASFAVSRIHLPASTQKVPWVTVLTVASPLAGTVPRAPNAEGKEALAFVLDLGTSIPVYPRSASRSSCHPSANPRPRGFDHAAQRRAEPERPGDRRSGSAAG